jgi:O-antigen/teichoic acid export membrane protein
MSALDLMNKDLDVTMLSPLLPAAQIGLYKMAKNIALLAWRAVDPFYLALMPELSRRVQMKDYVGTQALLRRSSAALGALAGCLSISAYLTLAYFGETLFGSEFAGMQHVISWMLVGVVISAPLVWGHPLAVALNRADLALTGSLLGLVVGLCVFVLLVPYVGIHGAAIAWTLSFLPVFLFTATAAYRLFRRRASVDGRPTSR